MKLISVITPVLNAERYLQRALESVNSQTYSAIEHIVVDGGSTDSTVEILHGYPQVKWISEGDSGQSDAMNKGFDLATGEIIVYLNGDDYFFPDTFNIVAREFEKGARLVFGNLEIHGPNGTVTQHQPTTDYSEMMAHWKAQFPINPIQYFYRRELQEGHPFNASNHFSMDHEFLLHICQKEDITRLNKCFGVFDMHEESKTIRGFNRPTSYWTHSNFEYIDQFLTAYPIEDVIDFKNRQYAFYLQQLSEYWATSSFESATNLLRFIEQQTEIIIYGAGTQTRCIWDLVHSRVKFIVDRRWKQIGLFNGITVKSLDALKGEVNPTLLVTPCRYREKIQADVVSANPDTHIVFLDDITK